MTGLKAVETTEAEAPWPAVSSMAIYCNVGAKMAAAEVLGIEERHDEKWSCVWRTECFIQVDERAIGAVSTNTCIGEEETACTDTGDREMARYESREEAGQMRCFLCNRSFALMKGAFHDCGRTS